MDAPPEHEDSQPFVHIASLLHEAGLNVPIILAQNLAQGLLLLSDLGPHTYYQYLQHDIPEARLQSLYCDALTALVRMQHVRPDGLPCYASDCLAQELELFSSWYIVRHHGVELDATTRAALQDIFTLLAHANNAQPTVFVHRDFHSPNLMLCEEARYGPNPGILDFQDAVAGPLTYDLASLITDARISWEEPQQLDWALRYWEMARAAHLPVDPDFAEFYRAVEWMSLQRNLRILGIFARLYYRDAKPHYLAHIPRLKRYVRQVAQRYQVFMPLLRLLDQLDNSLSAGSTASCMP
jgi:aminoglycoside/choline kinase family phosphotransferase